MYKKVGKLPGITIIQGAHYATLFILILVTAWLRLANLGYSDYQGDEIKALEGPVQGQSLVESLLAQRKGPLQFIIAYLVRLIHPSLTNEFLTRLPFATAGILSVYFFYRLVELHYGRKIAIYASVLLSINGLFIGLTRIVQYQSLVILFSVLALYSFSQALKSRRWAKAGIYAGFLFWVVAILAHYDGIFIAPAAIYLLVRWYTSQTGLPIRARLKHLLIPAALSGLLLGMFFIPYFLELGDRTMQYWLERITGEDTQNRVSSSLITFKLYNPLLSTYFYIVVGIFSLFQLRKTLPVWLWFLFPWIILEGMIANPGTHIYTYIIPACILVANGVSVFEQFCRRLLGHRVGKILVTGGMAVTMLFLFSVSHLIFVDHTPEYPLENRRILFWTIGVPDRKFHAWIFGFPYYRHWEQIGEFIRSAENNRYYATNEKESLSDYYIPSRFDINQSVYYIHIYHPQNFHAEMSNKKIRYWTKNYPPVKMFENEGRTVAEIYQMPEGTLKEIRKQGY
jgi:4-amino-4-deoxy-L-arabinose transferase-like glycosyltransferase